MLIGAENLQNIKYRINFKSQNRVIVWLRLLYEIANQIKADIDYQSIIVRFNKFIQTKNESESLQASIQELELEK